MLEPIAILCVVLCVALIVQAWLHLAVRRQRDEALNLATTVLGQRDQLQGELRRAAVAWATLFDLLSLCFAWRESTREQAQTALVAWQADPADATARAALEAAGVPVAWLDGAAPLLLTPTEDV
jgi:hypothetical protein